MITSDNHERDLTTLISQIIARRNHVQARIDTANQDPDTGYAHGYAAGLGEEKATLNILLCKAVDLGLVPLGMDLWAEPAK